MSWITRIFRPSILLREVVVGHNGYAVVVVDLVPVIETVIVDVHPSFVYHVGSNICVRACAGLILYRF
jgi:hypothetical protein